jgi:hypothetical protein
MSPRSHRSIVAWERGGYVSSLTVLLTALGFSHCAGVGEVLRVVSVHVVVL